MACSLGVRHYLSLNSFSSNPDQIALQARLIFSMSGPCCRQSYTNRSCRRCSKLPMPKQHNEEPFGLRLALYWRQQSKQQDKTFSKALD